MMSRNNRRKKFFEEEKGVNRIFVFSFSVLVIAIISFVVTFLIYRNYLNKKSSIAEFKTAQITNTLKENVEKTESASSNIGKSVNELQNEKTNEVQKIAINTSNMQKESISKVSEEKQNSKVKDETEIKTSANTIKKEEPIPDPTFKKPVEGEITNKFAKDVLIYSNTLEEWVTHNGIDIKADKTTVVKAASNGTIKTIKNDPRYGITVTIEHANGYTSVYANLLTAEFVKEGEKVEQGQTIGTVGNTATFEIADEPHLHFEILKNGEYLDPEQYIK